MGISSLIKNNLYPYGPYLELLFRALLFSDNRYYDEIIEDKEKQTEESELEKIASMIPQIIKQEFIKCRKQKKVLKLDKISNGIQPLFYDPNSCQLSMSRIYQFAPNINQLHLYEQYDINNEFITKFLKFIKIYEPSKIELDTIKVFKYSFEGKSQQFQQYISKSNEMELNNKGWYIYQHHDQKSYKFILTKKKRK